MGTPGGLSIDYPEGVDTSTRCLPRKSRWDAVLMNKIIPPNVFWLIARGVIFFVTVDNKSVGQIE